MEKYSPLQSGDEIRVIASSLSERADSKRQYERAFKRLESLGYKVTFGKRIKNVLYMGTAKATDRADDLNDAYKDKNVKAILAMQGGWLSNEVLPYIDWELLKNNPKPMIGFSDITALLNAIYAKTGNIGYLGPTYHIIGNNKQWRYTLDNLYRVLSGLNQIELTKSEKWGTWTSRKNYKTKPWVVLQEGKAEGVLIGGNLGTFYLLQGTEYQPSFDTKFILAIEDDDEAGKYTAREFSRRLESILQLPNVRSNLQGVIIGRFQPDGKVSEVDIVNIVISKQLGEIPVICGVDFGHTLPMLTLPIGGNVTMSATKTAKITIVN